MDNRVETGRESWRAVLRAGGAAAIPRWTLDPAPGVAEHVATLDDDLAAGVRRLAYELPLHSVALAAHAKVLAALSGEQDVVIGYAARPGGRPLPCPLTTEARSRRSLLQDTAQVESDLLQHRDFATDELKRELGVAGPAFETEFDRIGSLDTGGKISTDLAEDAVLRVALATPGGRLALHLHYRTDALDAGSAERIAGYHLTALALMVADPGAEHGRASLPSDEEPRFQLYRLAGPRRELPDRRFHELFEQRVRMHPDAVAAVHRNQQQWTYRELNARQPAGAGAAGAWPAPRGRGRGGDRAEPGLDGLRHLDLQGRWHVSTDRAVFGPALGDEPAQGTGLGFVGCQAKAAERNPPK